MHICEPYMCLVPTEATRGVGSTEPGVIVSCEPLY